MTTTMLAPKPGRNGGDRRGNTRDRRQRKAYLVQAYRADTDVVITVDVDGEVLQHDPGFFSLADILELAGENASYVSVEQVAACRCYRCGRLLSIEGGNITADRIVPGCVKTREYPDGGTYERKNIRPACGGIGGCNESTGGALGNARKRALR